jgi:hypothetical protein
MELSFPIEVQAYRLWFKATDPIGFFTEFGAWKNPIETTAGKEKNPRSWKIKF